MNRPKKTSGKKGTDGNPVAASKSAEHAGKIKNQKIDKTGLTSRIRGHVSARGKRAQGKRDAR